MRALWLRIRRFLVAIAVALGLARAPAALPPPQRKPARPPAAQPAGHVGANAPNRAALLSRLLNPLGRQRRAYVRAVRRKSVGLTSAAEQLALEHEAAQLFTRKRVG